jgi:hypothetical protein
MVVNFPVSIGTPACQGVKRLSLHRIVIGSGLSRI